MEIAKVSFADGTPVVGSHPMEAVIQAPCQGILGLNDFGMETRTASFRKTPADT